MTQYPELAEELEEEIKRMEKENAEKQADVERLQNEIAKDSASDNRSDPGTAFVRGGAGAGVDDGSDEIISDEATDDLQAVDDGIDAWSDLDDTEIEEEEEDDDEEEEIDPSSSVETIESPNKEDLTLTHLAVESLRVLIKNAQDDVRRIINLAVPVLQPLFDVGDAAWKQMKDLFVKARKAYEAYQATSMASEEGTQPAETCEDTA